VSHRVSSPIGLSILGSTGSVGRAALDVVRRHPGRFEVVGLAAGRNAELFREQVAEFRPRVVSLREEAAAEALARDFPGVKAGWGEEGAVAVAAHAGATTVLAAIVGAAGLRSSHAALRAGKRLALANKESMVVAGALMCRAAEESGAAIVPVDSEHSAVFQCLAGGRREEVRRVILTASGGPFRGRNRHELASVTPEQALKHPTWEMGAKISIDSATLMNKGLEVIEAHFLFGLRAEEIRVLVHPQSIVHSMVEYGDGSILAHLGRTDMKIPIQFALSWPERWEDPCEPFDLAKAPPLEFHEPDMETFPCLGLGYEALARGGAAPAALNAANEIAVEAFLQKHLPFAAIAEVNARVMRECPAVEAAGIEDILAVDREARERAERMVEKGKF
jgi:1-deoxy-D-xylulose-5-phosphate reductoisomerase